MGGVRALRPERTVVDGEDGEVAGVPDGVDPCPVFHAAAVPADLHEGLIGDDVREVRMPTPPGTGAVTTTPLPEVSRWGLFCQGWK